MIYDTITSYTRRTPAEFRDARRQGGVQLDTKKVVDDLTDVGADILGAVTEAINSNDYSNLSRTINESLGSVVRNYTNGSVNEKGYGDVRRGTGAYTPYRQAARAKRQQETVAPFMSKRVSRMTGSGGQVAGILGMTAGVTLAAIFGIIGLSFELGGMAVGAALGALIFGGSLAGYIMSGKKRKLVKQYYEYARIIGDDEYITIEELSDKTGRSRDQILDDLEQMSKQGMLPQVWYDSDKTTLILTRNVYDQYKQTESYRQDLVKQAQEEAATWGNISGDVKSIIEEGNNYKDKIHQYNKEIDDEVMSDKLSRLEEIMNRIFEQVRKQPDTAPKLRKLMQYYLPTTTKLLEAYIELDRQPEAGTNITQTKKEIEDVLDTINDAFEQLLDSMFEDMAWDISSDISVMKSMMNQDGLVQEQGLGQVQEQGQIQ